MKFFRNGNWGLKLLALILAILLYHIIKNEAPKEGLRQAVTIGDKQ